MAPCVHEPVNDITYLFSNTTIAAKTALPYHFIDPSPAAQHANMKSILLIEDNISILENLAEYLELEGYLVFKTNSGNRGIEMALEFLPDLIICDMPKPGIDGYQVLRTLISTANISEIPFIFCTAMSENFYRTDALALGADDYILKPFELESLLRTVKVHIQTGSKRQTLQQ